MCTIYKSITINTLLRSTPLPPISPLPLATPTLRLDRIFSYLVSELGSAVSGKKVCRLMCMWTEERCGQWAEGEGERGREEAREIERGGGEVRQRGGGGAYTYELLNGLG